MVDRRLVVGDLDKHALIARAHRRRGQPLIHVDGGDRETELPITGLTLAKAVLLQFQRDGVFNCPGCLVHVRCFQSWR